MTDDLVAREVERIVALLPVDEQTLTSTSGVPITGIVFLGSKGALAAALHAAGLRHRDDLEAALDAERLDHEETREALNTAREERGADLRAARIDGLRLAEAFYNVTRQRMGIAVLPPWRDPSIGATVWDKSVADGRDIAAEYDRLASQTREEGT